MKILIAFAALALTAAAQTFPIAGVVVDARSGTPMNRVRVTLIPWAPSDERAIVTAADGKFSFEVPKGKFRITAESRGSRETFGQRSPSVSMGVAIFTGPDRETSNLIFRWFAPGAISGKVSDDRGEPVESALVQLIQVTVAGGRKTRRTAAFSRTNDLGEYRFGGRAGGVYYLAVTGEPWYTAHSQPVSIPGMEAQEAPGEPAPSYLPVYYPNANDPKGAQALELAPGAEIVADFRLSISTGVKVHVHCPQSPGQTALISLLSDGAAGVNASQRQAWLTGNDQTIAGVLPGHYQVLVEGRNGNTSSARTAIDVGGSDVTVELAMGPPPSVSGKVTFKDPARKLRRGAYVRLIDDSNFSAVTSPIDPSGSFSFDNVPPGRRRVQIGGADGFFASQISAEGARIDGPMIDIEPGANVRLTVTASDEIGSLKGFVMNGDQPVAGVLAVLAPQDDSNDPASYRGFQTDSDGSFDYQNVRAGEYVLFAVENVELEYANPAAVRPYLASGKLVTIVPHAAVVENATLAAPTPQN